MQSCRCTNLESLNLTLCRNITDAGLTTIGAGCPRGVATPPFSMNLL